jgi:uncharacterized protein YjbI with pentapeptide repeats
MSPNSGTNKVKEPDTLEFHGQVHHNPGGEDTFDYKVEKGAIHLWDDTQHTRNWVDWIKDLGLPLFGVAVTIVLGIIANNFTVLTKYNEEVQRYLTVASEASGQRQKDLTDYSHKLSDMLSQNPIDVFDVNNWTKAEVLRNRIRAETIVVLKRLNDTKHHGYIKEGNLVTSIDDIAYVDLPNTYKQLKAPCYSLFGWDWWDSCVVNAGKPEQKFITKKTQPIQQKIRGFNDSGEIKGILVRSLYESELINSYKYGRDPNIISLLSGCDLRNTYLNSQPLPHVDLRNAEMQWSTFYNAKLPNAKLEGTKLEAADMRGIDLTNADLKTANLRGANFQPAEDQNSILKGADLRGANLSPYTYPLTLTKEHKEQYEFYQKKENKDVVVVDESICKLLKGEQYECTRITNLSGADLSGANLSSAILIDADLSNATQDHLADTDFTNADLSGANVENVDFSKAKGLTAEQVKKAQNWNKAIYNENLRTQLDISEKEYKRLVWSGSISHYSKGLLGFVNEH